MVEATKHSVRNLFTNPVFKSLATAKISAKFTLKKYQKDKVISPSAR